MAHAPTIHYKCTTASSAIATEMQHTLHYRHKFFGLFQCTCHDVNHRISSVMARRHTMPILTVSRQPVPGAEDCSVQAGRWPQQEALQRQLLHN